MNRILIIDDDTFICQVIQKFLKSKSFDVDIAFTGKSGLKKIKNNSYGLVLCDYRLPDSNGLEILKKIKDSNNKTQVIIITAYADVKLAVKLMKHGAYDYITKPLQQEEILNHARKIIPTEKSHISKSELPNDFIAGESKAFKDVLALAKKVASTNMSVLIEGETGTGKEYIARFIHKNSKRKAGPFIAVDCGAIPKELAGSELFGHIKGSFTGAIENKHGVFYDAQKGTLFLDEIGNLDYKIQVQLLRALQEKKITRIGENKPMNVDVRIITATNETLSLENPEVNFREDLLYRINEFKIKIPPLRKRKKDILTYANHFREIANYELEKNVSYFSKETIEVFKQYKWHGNLRELKNVVKRAVLLTGDNIIKAETLPPEIVNPDLSNTLNDQKSAKRDSALKNVSADFEKQTIINAIIEAGYNKSEAARNLKIDRKTLYNKIKQYNIDI